MAGPPTIQSNAKLVSRFAKNATLDMVKVLTGAIFYGIYLVLLLAALSILLRRDGQRKARIGLLAVLLVMFAMSSFEFWGIVHLCFRSIQIVLVNDIDTPYASKQAAFRDAFTHFGSAIQVMLPLETILGDSILLWRVVKLCPENRKLVYIPTLFLFGTTVTSLGFFGCYAKNDWPVATPDLCNRLQISAFTLSMATNLSGTLVVLYKVWIYRQAVKAYLDQCRQRTKAERVLTLILESGFIYSTLWIIQLVIVLLPPVQTFPGQVVQQIFTVASIQLVGIYPTLLVVLVYLERSMWDPAGTLSANPTRHQNNSVTVYDVSGSRSTLGSPKMA